MAPGGALFEFSVTVDRGGTTLIIDSGWNLRRSSHFQMDG